MKKISLILFALGIAVSASAQLSLENRAVLRSHKMQSLNTENLDVNARALASVGAPISHIPGMIRLADGATAADLEAEGVNVIKTRGRIALVTIPAEDAERVSSLKAVKTLQLSRKAAVKMDKARESIGANKVHSGEGLPQAYTGKGVVTGIIDTGMDPRHINFKDSEGKNRIKQLSHIYMNSTGTNYVDNLYTDELSIETFGTDYEGDFHGTHTTGIMAGGYMDTALVAKKVSPLSNTVKDSPVPFYGMATESDIIMSCGDLYDMFIALGIEDVLNYAWDNNKPAVINMSLGSNVGAHDGTSVMNEFLDLAGKEAIICMAAGNEGDIPIALNQTFTAEDQELKTFIYPYQGNFPLSDGSTFYNLRYGTVYIYSNDATEFVVKAVIYNQSRKTFTLEIPISSNSNGEAIYYASPSWAESGDKSSANFNNAFEGYVGIGSMIDEANGRYYAMIDYCTGDNIQTNANGNYILGFIVTGKEGQRIDCFCDGAFTYFSDYGQSGWDTGSTNGTISDMACGDNVLVVGSYNTRDDWASINGKAYSYSGTFKAGKISGFSSYGTLVDGRNLPHICAPGAAIISSCSTPYVKANNITDGAYFQAKLEKDGQEHYWQQAIGTSMATPVVSGGVALWLEADPTLTIDEVKDIITTTAVKDANVTSFTGDPVQWGAGKFDVYEGLKEVIRRKSSSVEKVGHDENFLVKTIGNRQYEVFLGGAEAVSATLYNTSGQVVLSKKGMGDELILDASGLATGVYILNVNGNKTQRILVK